MSDAPVQVDTVFERFPASVRGALVVKGIDGDPHQIRLIEAAVVEVSGKPVRPVAVGAVTVDVVPRGEVLIPYDIPFAGLDPGWYRVAAEVVVDGSVQIRGPAGGGPRFSVAWPRGVARRGSLEASVKLGGPGSVVVEQVDCRSDSALVRWRHEPGDDPGDLQVLGDGRRLAVIDSSGDPGTGNRTTLVYPVLKAHRTLTFEVRGRGEPKRSAKLALP